MNLTGRPVVHTLPVGGFANQMIRTMAAVSIAQRVENCLLSNIQLPDWGIDHPSIPGAGGLTAGYHSPRLMDLKVDNLIQNLRMGNIERVEISSYAQHMDNFLPVDSYRALFPDMAQDVPSFGSDHLVINIRGAEILDARHPDYTLIPIEYYRDIINVTRLAPVFMGQLEDNRYVERLKAAFPFARYIPSLGPLRDFALIRRANNICVSISTFSWLAAFLSNASRIFLPLSGLFNPAQFPEIDLLPLADSRYEFHLFPINYAVPVAFHELAHAAMHDRWSPVTPDRIRRIRRTQPGVPVDKAKFFHKFDAEFYLATYADVHDSIRQGAVSSPLQHYVSMGFYQRRLPFRFDRVAYVRSHVEAAVAIANGEYAHPLHHFIEVGDSKGYAPF